jgi:AraC family transcriptional regulator of adaptative response/methylated-DNA-[protein]-cysteine methyltransferase
MPTDAEMRRAIAARDTGYDDRFVYAVVTTGVFCRPSCAARAARPENLRFFIDNEAATAAGFRACKRCRPTTALTLRQHMIEVARHIEANFDNRITLADLGKRFAQSPSRLQRAFKSVFGISPREYQDGLRTRRFQSLLRDGQDVSAAIYEAGFSSPSRVYGDAAHHVGMTPTAYRAGGAGETIHFASRDTVVGKMMMAATEKGVCFAQFGDSHRQLRAQLEAEFPKASLVASPAGESAELDAWIDALNDHLASQGPRPDIPLDLRGTAFQISVWRFLLSTGDGDVVSYAEVAAAIDRPKAQRAAASACGANRIAVLVPCHRVLRGDGGIGGYRWGVARKRALLDAERARRALT